MEKFNAFERDIDFAFWQEICESHGELRHYRRGEYFVNSGDGLKYCGWIRNGGFKHALSDCDGCLKTVGFVFSNAVLANYSAIMSGGPMPTAIIALEDSDVIILELVPLGEIASYLNISRRQLHRFRETPDSQAD